MKAKQERSMQEEQISDALNAHWRASAGDINAEHDTMTMRSAIILNQANESSDEGIAGLAESSSR